MNKVLIIARYFGTRIPGLLKYLPEFGWQPILLTTNLPSDSQLPADTVVTETSYREALGFWKRILGKDVGATSGSWIEGNLGPASGKSIFNRIIGWGGEVINYPDSYKGWRKLAVKAGDELLRREKIDVILSSSSPVTGHLIARELKRKHRIPWIADLRDLWSQNHNYYYSSLRKIFDKRLELKTLSEADALVTVSQSWADRLGTLHQGKSVSAITNGFDPEIMKEVSTGVKPGFTITYTGNIYGRNHSPRRLFAALRDLISDGTLDPYDVEVRFYGPRLAWLEKEISKCGLSGIVKQYGMVSQQVAIEKQKKSQLLWLMDWDDSAENGWYPLKAFEYLGTGRPILATGGAAGNAVDVLLTKTAGGIHAVTTDSIKNALRDYYNEYKLKGELSYHGLRDEIDKYTHRRMTGEFVAILEGLLER